MPWFAFIGHDGPRGLEVRGLRRPPHLAGLAELGRTGRIRHAGPILGEDGAPLGSLVVFEAADLAEARGIAARDVYVTEGIFARYEVRETMAVFPKAD